MDHAPSAASRTRTGLGPDDLLIFAEPSVPGARCAQPSIDSIVHYAPVSRRALLTARATAGPAAALPIAERRALRS